MGAAAITELTASGIPADVLLVGSALIGIAVSILAFRKIRGLFR